MRTFLCIVFMFSLTKIFCQNNASTPNFYWEHGVKKYSKDMSPNVFYLRLINESLNDSIQNRQKDQKIRKLLKGYQFTIEHKGVADDHIGHVFYRKLVFQNTEMDSKTLKEIYQKMYAYDQIEFFGPQIYDMDVNYGAGLQRSLDITFNAKTSKEEIEKIVKKYKLKVLGEFPAFQTISARLTDAYGLKIINVTTQIQQETCVSKTLNHIYVQAVY